MALNTTQLATIESMPTELLPDIFVASLNPNLPLASPTIAQKLSSQHVYLAFCKDLFIDSPRTAYYRDPTPCSCHREEVPHGDNFLRCQASARDLHDRHRRGQILATKWFTFEFFKMFVEHQFGAHRREFCNPEDGYYVEKYGGEVWYPARNYDLYPESYPELDRIVQHVSVPKKLLRGPWTTSNVKFLDWLLSIDACIDTNDASTCRAILEGFRHAERVHDADALRLLEEKTKWKCRHRTFVQVALSASDCPLVVLQMIYSQLQIFDVPSSRDLGFKHSVDEWARNRTPVGYLEGVKKENWLRKAIGRWISLKDTYDKAQARSLGL